MLIPLYFQIADICFWRCDVTNWWGGNVKVEVIADEHLTVKVLTPSLVC